MAAFAVVVAINDANRNARLFATSTRQPHYVVNALFQYININMGHILFIVRNNGARGVDNFQLTVLVPNDIVLAPDVISSTTMTLPGDTTTYAVVNFTQSAPEILYPNSTPGKQFDTELFTVKTGVKSFAVKWRIYDMSDTYPGPSTFNDLDVTIG